MSGEQKKGFDLAGLMKSVSNLNTREQIEYLPFDRLDPDPDNFYSLEGLNDLADNIATVGLVHPLRVRQNGERYTVTSGHRRRAAIQLLIDSGEDWSNGVPCIIDHSECLPEFDELKLIFANNQRVKSSAELSREAERVEELLYQLKEKGYEFPGRMRDHVAAAVNVNKSKLARLHAIRSNAQEYVLEAYDNGEINESVTYEFSKLPSRAQELFMIQRRRACLRLDILTAEEVKEYGGIYFKLLNLQCVPCKGLCSYSGERIVEALRQLNGYHEAGDEGKPLRCGNCTKGKCCLTCVELLDCEAGPCRYTEPEVKRREAAKAQREEELASAHERDQHLFDRARQEAAEANATIWGRIRRAAVASGEDLEDVLDNYAESFDDLCELVDFANGRKEDYHNAAHDLLAEELETLADELHCSTDFLLGRTDEPAVNRGERIATPSCATARNDGADDAPPGASASTEDAEVVARWLVGEPEKDGWYACLGTWADIPERTIVYWRDGSWYEEKNSRREMTSTKIHSFYPLPEIELPARI